MSVLGSALLFAPVLAPALAPVSAPVSASVAAPLGAATSHRAPFEEQDPDAEDPDAAAPGAEDLGRAAATLLENKCAGCHHPDSEDPKAVRYWKDATDLAATIEEIVVPGNTDLSDLFLLVDDGEMPPEDSEVEPLEDAEKDLLRRWIEAGAPLPGPTTDTVVMDPVTSVDPVDSEGSESATSDPEDGAEGEGAPDSGQDPTGTEDAGPEDGNAPRTFEDWTRWLGTFHPALVHFPIALLLAAALAEGLVLVGASGLRSAGRFSLWLGSLGAIVAAAVGWFAGEFASATREPFLTQHRWMGVGTAALALLALFAGELRARAQARDASIQTPWVLRYRLVLFATAALVGLTGHWGGTLTFGEGYLRLLP